MRASEDLIEIQAADLSFTERRKERKRKRIIALDEIREPGLVTAELMGRKVLVMLVDGKPRAYVNTCMHNGGPLARTGDRLVCQWHGPQYETKTGRASRDLYVRTPG